MTQNSAQILNAYRDIYEQYVDEASFLWVMRSIAVHQPHYDSTDIAELEGRIQAQLDGLMTAPDLSWEICQQALELEGPGEVFTAAVIAIQSHQQDRIQQVVETGLASEEAFPGLVSAFGWLSAEISHPWIERFLNSKDLDHKYLALAVCSIRRENPGQYLDKYLQREDCIQHKKLYCRALRLIGELKRQDLVEALNTGMGSDDEDVVFWSSWSAVLLGNNSAVSRLGPYVFAPGSHQIRAIAIAFRVLPLEQAREWISRLAADSDQQRAAIKAVGALGDPQAIDWLIAKTQDAALSRLAGEAFSLITGIDLDENALSGEQLTGIQNIPNDDAEDNNVEMDEDENLPWPDSAALSLFWEANKHKFMHGRRYICGHPVEPGCVVPVGQSTLQRHRQAIAIESAICLESQAFSNPNTKIQV